MDDDAILRMDALEIPTTAGFLTVEAEDYNGAILVLEEHHISVTRLCSDVKMSGSRNGFALATRYR